MSSIRNADGPRSARSLCRTLLACAALVALAAPSTAWAVPVTSALSSGPEALRGVLASPTPSISLAAPDVDRVTIQVVGLAIDPIELGLHDRIARPLERAMDLSVVGTATMPSPEHAFAFVFAVGLAILGHRLNRFPPIEADEALL